MKTIYRFLWIGALLLTLLLVGCGFGAVATTATPMAPPILVADASELTLIHAPVSTLEFASAPTLVSIDIGTGWIGFVSLWIGPAAYDQFPGVR